MIKIVLSLLFLSGVLLPVASAQSGENNIICTTPREADIIMINISGTLSLQGSRVTLTGPWQRERQGAMAILQHREYQYTVKIKDVDNFSEVDDYFTIRTKQGHQISFPLHCTNIATGQYYLHQI